MNNIFLAIQPELNRPGKPDGFLVVDIMSRVGSRPRVKNNAAVPLFILNCGRMDGFSAMQDKGGL